MLRWASILFVLGLVAVLVWRLERPTSLPPIVMEVLDVQLAGAANAPQRPAPTSQNPRVVPAEVPANLRAGIRCPDGSYLPPLNGVAPTDPIPPIQREPFMPPIGEVVGKYVDDEGFEWWVTEDGSAFTTRWVTLHMPDGSLQKMVRTDQADSLGGDRFAMPRSR